MACSGLKKPPAKLANEFARRPEPEDCETSMRAAFDAIAHTATLEPHNGPEPHKTYVANTHVPTTLTKKQLDWIVARGNACERAYPGID